MDTACCGVDTASCGVDTASCGVDTASCGVDTASCGVDTASCDIETPSCGEALLIKYTMKQKQSSAGSPGGTSAGQIVRWHYWAEAVVCSGSGCSRPCAQLLINTCLA